jgi:uncharacterized protein (DUF58 family)
MKRYLSGRMARWIRRRQGDDSLPLTLARRRLYILPTRAGTGFGLLLILMLVAGLNYANSLALFLAFLLIGFALTAMHLCHRNLLGARLAGASAPPTFASRSGTLSLTFENDATVVRYRIAAGIGDEPTLPADLPPQGRAHIDLPVTAARRGIVRLGRLRLTTTYPFGLFRTWTWVHAPIEMLVYPRACGTLPMPTHGGSKSGVRSHTLPGSDEWLGLRPFRDGDSPRQVDWKAYAREGPLLVKEYSAAGSELRVLRFDMLSDLPVEVRLEQLARWVVDAETSGVRYGLELPDVQIKPDSGTQHRHRCLAALAMFALEDATHGEA